MIHRTTVLAIDEFGQTLKSKQQSLCYGPTRRDETLAHLNCDRDSFFYKKSFKACCIEPQRVDLETGALIKRGYEVCGDTMADFSPVDNKMSYKAGTTCGPSTIQDFTWGARLLSKCYANRGRFQKPVSLKEACRGEVGTLITKLESKGNHTYDFCPAGTSPLGSQGSESMYHSWHCMERKVRKTSEFCCRVRGTELCGREMVDSSEIEGPCQCGDNDEVVMNDATGQDVVRA